jgi:hypothetical protein
MYKSLYCFVNVEVTMASLFDSDWSFGGRWDALSLGATKYKRSTRRVEAYGKTSGQWITFAKTARLAPSLHVQHPQFEGSSIFD